MALSHVLLRLKLPAMSSNNFRLAQTLISLCSLIFGLTFFFLISLWVKDELSYDTGFADPDRIGRVETNLILTDGTTSSLPTVGWPVGRALAAEYPGNCEPHLYAGLAPGDLV